MRRAVGAAFAIVAAVTTSAGVTAQELPPGFEETTRAAPPGVDMSQADVVPISKNGVYIVVMGEEPAAGYAGEIAGLPSTKPAEGEKLSRNDGDVQRYVAHLDATHVAALAGAGISNDALLASYHYVANGFSAKLTGEQAQALSAQSGVRLVVPDTVRKVSRNVDEGDPDNDDGQNDTTSAAFLDLTGPDGPYANGINGEGVVVGIIDTGIWPEHPSLNPTGFGPAPASFVGTGCDFGNYEFNTLDAAFSCNNKVLAAKSYHAALTADDLLPGSYLSARDDDGHGTHTSTTAAGNANVSASILGSDFGTITGIAPRARISTYKVCWNGEAGGCSQADTAAAIDDAVADGVDVINFSIGGPTPVFGLDDFSFFFANHAGVFVARSAGNEGPAPQTVGTAAVSPWVTTVGASTTDSTFESTVTLGDGQAFSGASVTAGVGPATLVDAAAIGNELCMNGVGFTEPIDGKIVLCKRGTNARVEKSREVIENGGAGMVLYNAVNPQEVVTDNHFVPSVHVTLPDGLAVKEYIATNGAAATATLSSAVTAPAQGSVMAAFSSRGPNGFSADIVTPDVTAPGVNILAGNTPTPFLSAGGQLFQSISGTSMAAPHVAGIYALIKQAHPEWSPAEAKSAMMTTARDDVVKEDGVTPADPFDMGAGHIEPGGEFGKNGSLFNPGVVYDADAFDYLGYTCETEPLFPVIVLDVENACDLLAGIGVSTTAENLNVASIGIGDVPGLATVTRTLTNVSDHKIKLAAQVEAPDGFAVTVTPATLKLRPGQSKSFTVTFTQTTAGYDTYSFGSLSWEGDGYDARSPIAVRAKQFSAPDLVSGSGDSGSIDIPVKFGYEGDYGAVASGLVSPTTVAGIVADDPANDITIALANGDFDLQIVTIPEGTALTRIGIRNTDVNPDADIDLYVFDSELHQVGGSGSVTSHETVDLVQPLAGDYFVVIHGFDTAGPASPYVLYDWSVPSTGGGSLSVSAAPTTATLAATGTVTVSWTGAGTAPEQMGVVAHSNADGVLAFTAVEINVLD